MSGATADSLGLDGTELFDIADANEKPKELDVTATKEDGGKIDFRVTVRIDTPKEWDYFMHGGILHYVLRKLASE
jgi:aconitate hydratase